VRWYRDTCGDGYIPGRWGEVLRLGVGRLGVQIGGPGANDTRTDVPEGFNARTLAVSRRAAWPVAQRGNGEAVFGVEDASMGNALRAIGGYRKRRGRRPAPEAIRRGADALKKWREQRQTGGS